MLASACVRRDRQRQDRDRLRLAYAVAKCSEVPFFYLDGKGDKQNAERFLGLMADAGRSTRVFPNHPFCCWRGRPRCPDLRALCREAL